MDGDFTEIAEIRVWDIQQVIIILYYVIIISSYILPNMAQYLCLTLSDIYFLHRSFISVMEVSIISLHQYLINRFDQKIIFIVNIL